MYVLLIVSYIVHLVLGSIMLEVSTVNIIHFVDSQVGMGRVASDGATCYSCL